MSTNDVDFRHVELREIDVLTSQYNRAEDHELDRGPYNIFLWVTRRARMDQGLSLVLLSQSGH
jgi:hypothetical protein